MTFGDLYREKRIGNSKASGCPEPVEGMRNRCFDGRTLATYFRDRTRFMQKANEE